MKSVFSIFLSLLLATGCSTGPYKYDPTKSAALNYATAGGVVGAGKQIKDVPREQVKQALERDGFDPDAELAVGVGLASAKYAGLMAATPGISNALGGSIFFLHSLFSSSYQPHLRKGMFAWMPTSMAIDEEDASHQMEKLLINAFKKAAPEGVEIDRVTKYFKSTLGIESQVDFLIVTGDRINCKLQDGEDACVLRISVNEPEKEISPEFIAHGPSYYWSRRKDEPRFFYYVAAYSFGKKSGRFKRDIPYYTSKEFYERMLQYLPGWVYAYMPPTKSRPYPIILNQGKTYYFIEPATTQAEKT